MRTRFDEGRNPDIKVVVAEYRDVVRKRMRWVGPLLGGLLVLLIALAGLYSVEPGEVAVVRTFGKESAKNGPGLHFAVPLFQQVDKVDLAKIRREEIGFRTTKGGPKLVPAEAQMLTGDENIVEVQMIVQYQVKDPSKYLFKLNEPEKTLHIAAEVALRGVVGQMRITSSIEDMREERGASLNQQVGAGGGKAAGGQGAPAGKTAAAGTDPNAKPEDAKPEDANAKPEDANAKPAGDAAPDAAAAGSAAPNAAGSAAPAAAAPTPKAKPRDEHKGPELGDPNPDGDDSETDILTKGRERAQIQTKELLQKLMDLYESGIRITEVKLLSVDAPDAVQDAFHDVVRAREQREQMINKALGYRQDRIPRARGEAQKIVRAAEAYKRERVLRSEGEAARFAAILAEYAKARNVTRERLHLETMERILKSVNKKVFIDESVAKGSVPILPLGGGGSLLGTSGGAANNGGQQ